MSTVRMPTSRSSAPPALDSADGAGRVRVDAALIGRFQVMVWRYLRFLGAPRALADDLSQETFLQLIQQPPLDRGEAALGAWLRTTARHRFFREGRRARRGLEHADPAILEAAWARWSTADSDDSAYRRALRACLERLPPRARRAIALRYGESSSRASIAAELRLTEDGVKTLLRRSRSQLQACILANLPADEKRS